MKRFIDYLRSFALIIVAAGMLVSCSNDFNDVLKDNQLPGNITISPSSSVTTFTQLTATYTGTESVTYQWNKNGEAISTDGTDQTYTPIEAGSYTVTVSAEGYQSKTSAAVSVALSTLTGTISIAPNSGTINTGTQLLLTYSGPETVSYQWYMNGTPIAAEFGGNLKDLTAYEQADYTVTLSVAGYQSMTSDPVAVNNGDTIYPLSGDVSVSPTGTVAIGTQLTASYTGSETSLTYQWEKNGVTIGSATSQTYTPTTAGSYTVTIGKTDFAGKTTTAVTVNSVALYIGTDISGTPVTLTSAGGSGITAIDKASVYIATNSHPEYTIVVGEDIDQTATIAHNKADTTITITTADSNERTIRKSGSGGLVIVGGTSPSSPSNAKLVIDGHITLKGITSGVDSATADNNVELVSVTHGGQLTLKGNAKVTGNTAATATTASSGGVFLYGNSINRAILTMEGNAEISYNHVKQTNGSSFGGGVFTTYANITLSGNAKIANNSAVAAPASDYYANGGGVYLVDTTLTMSGGEISGNLAKSTNGRAQGGGVFIDSGGRLNMSDGVIKDNILEFVTYGTGGGVHNDGTFNLSGSAKVTPKGSPAGYTTTSDDRNSIYLAGSGYSLRIQGILNESTVGLIDVSALWNTSNPLLLSGSGSSAIQFTSGAPTDKFTLGLKITTGSATGVVQPAIGGTWNTSPADGKITGL
ncbi:hypothetical protein FACS189487_10890 [Campylobacterota bacterium]|nr:hypothetical protein FACS189487_10890 [Campylobacterota bacterium]